MRAHAEKERQRRESPERYKQVKAKISGQVSNKDFEFSLFQNGRAEGLRTSIDRNQTEDARSLNRSQFNPGSFSHRSGGEYGNVSLRNQAHSASFSHFPKGTFATDRTRTTVQANNTASVEGNDEVSPNREQPKTPFFTREQKERFAARD